MKKITFILLIFSATTSLFSQWTTDDSDIYYNSGSVGIGTIPSYPLDIQLTTPDLILNLNNFNSKAGTAIGLNCDNKSNYQWRLTGRTPYSDLPGGFSIEFFKNKSTLYRYLNITSDGDIGIGVDDPQYKLDVDGDINISSGHNLLIDGSPINLTDSSNWEIESSNLYYNLGYVGIGTVPSYPLDVQLSAPSVILNLNNINSKAGTAIGLNCDIESNYQWRLTGRTLYSDLPGGFSIELFKDKSTLYRYLNITSDGNVGIGVDDPVEKVEVNGNVLIKDNNALILTSPNGTQFKITVDDYGNLTTEAVVSTNSVDSLSSLETIVDAEVEIYPNPTQSKISVNINKTDLSDVNVELYDIKGKLVFMQNFNSSQFDCNINNLSKGTYIVRIKDSDNKIIATNQIIKK